MVTFFLDSGEWQAEDVSERTLEHAAGRVAAAAIAAAELSKGRPPALRDVRGRALLLRALQGRGLGSAQGARLPRGRRRNMFATLTSLLPGTVPAGEEDAQILYHCLDIQLPVVAELAEEEAALVRALYND